MSRAARRYRKWERGAREAAWQDGVASPSTSTTAAPARSGRQQIGLALEPGEVLFRQVWARYWTLGTTTELVDSHGRVRVVPPAWRDWGWCQAVITSHRLATRLSADGSRLVSNWWASIAGVQLDLARDMVVLDDRASSWRGAYGGPAAAIVAVAAVERVHGPAALVHHPALGVVRDFADRDIELRRANL